MALSGCHISKIRAIDGGKKQRAKTMAGAYIVECPKCTSRRIRDEYVGRVIGRSGKVVHKGTHIIVCGQCGHLIE